MIVKHFEIRKINSTLNKVILLYGKNDGLKDEATNFLIKKDTVVSVYEESSILDDPESFIESLKSKSLFEEKKTIIIKRASDKILKIIDELNEEEIDDILIINSENLEKKSKLRIFFEKHKNYICVAFYPDNNETLLKLANNFFHKRKILISNENLNQIVNKSSGNRKNLIGELEKIDLFCANRKKN